MFLTGDIQFHDPAEFTPDINEQQAHEKEGLSHDQNRQPHTVHAHEDHGHGIGESLDSKFCQCQLIL